MVNQQRRALEVLCLQLHRRVLGLATSHLSPKGRARLEAFTLLSTLGVLAMVFWLHTRFVGPHGVGTQCLVRQLPAGVNASRVLKISVGGWAAESGGGAESAATAVSAAAAAAAAAATAAASHYLFAPEKGLLLLPRRLRERHGLRQLDVRVDGADACVFGDSAAQRAVLSTLVGYDTVVFNAMAAAYGGAGWVRCLQAADQEEDEDYYSGGGAGVGAARAGGGRGAAYTEGAPGGAGSLTSMRAAADVEATRSSLGARLSYKLSIALTTAFLFFNCTSLVAFIFRETQHKVLGFAGALRGLVASGRPLGAAMTRHVLEALMFVPVMLGMLFFLFEFYGDQLLAFAVLLLVWQAEVFSVVSMRTSCSVRIFPRAVATYFAFFHIYFFCFPFGFTYSVLLASALGLQHAILLLLNRHELQALHMGRISEATPRERGSGL
jgi:hypothetical protein